MAHQNAGLRMLLVALVGWGGSTHANAGPRVIAHTNARPGSFISRRALAPGSVRERGKNGPPNSRQPAPRGLNFANRPLDDARGDELRLITGLRERRLFGLAEFQCQQLLAQPDLSPTTTVEYTIQWIKTQTARALLSSGPENDSCWEKAEQTADRFLRDHSDNPRALLVQVQSALTHLAHGQLLRQELAAEMVPEIEIETKTATAIDELRTANSLLDEIRRAIVKIIREQRGRTTTANELTTPELMALKNNVRFQSAIADLNRAQLYATGDAAGHELDRVDALSVVLERLGEVQRETSLGQPLWWSTQIQQIRCFRLLGRFDDAQRVAERLGAVHAESINAAESTASTKSNQSAESYPQALLEQQLRLAVDRDEIDMALERLRFTEHVKRRTPQLDLARLAVALDFSLRGTGGKKADWLSQAAQITRQIEEEHGRYWGRRAQLSLIDGHPSGRPRAGHFEDSANEDIANRSATHPAQNPGSDSAMDSVDRQPRNGDGDDADGLSAELDLLVGLAEQAKRKQRFADAVKAYDRAAELAKRIGTSSPSFSSPSSFSLSVKSSQAIEKMQQHKLAANRLVELAIENPAHDLAPAAHLRGCWNWAQTMGDNRDRQQQFGELLAEHLKTWPRADSVPQIRLWLGGQKQLAHDWESAFENYGAVPVGHPQFGSAIERVVYCVKRWWDSSPPNERGAIAKRVTGHLQRILDDSNPETLGHSRVGLALADVGMRYGTVSPADLARLLDNILERAPSLEAGDPMGARARLLSVSVFDTSRQELAADLLGEIRASRSALAIAERGMDSISSHHPDLVSVESLRWRLQVVEAALAESESPGDRETMAWRIRKSDALVALGQEDEAIAVLLALEEAQPLDAGIQLRIARGLTRVHVDDGFEKPLARWRKLATRLKPQTENWYEAKYHVAMLLEKLGRSEDARKLLKYLQAIPPGWKHSQWRVPFETLLKNL